MQVFGVHAVACGRVVFFDGERIQEAVEVLHVGNIATEADDAGISEGAETLDVCESGEGAIGC
jgi:hypothetical protein